MASSGVGVCSSMGGGCISTSSGSFLGHTSTEGGAAGGGQLGGCMGDTEPGGVQTADSGDGLMPAHHHHHRETLRQHERQTHTIKPKGSCDAVPCGGYGGGGSGVSGTSSSSPSVSYVGTEPETKRVYGYVQNQSLAHCIIYNKTQIHHF